MSAAGGVKPPKLWKYVLGATVALIILIPLWTLFVMLVIEPDSLIIQEPTMSKRFLWWVAGPLVAVALFFGVRWVNVSDAARATTASNHAKAQAQAQAQKISLSDQAKREYVLEVIGLGVTLDKYRQGKLWEALQHGSPFATIREQDVKKYEWSALDKEGVSGGRGGDSLENGAQYTPMYFGVPVFHASPPISNEIVADKPNAPNIGLAGSARSSGMAWHMFVVGPRRFDEHPDRILEDVFDFFDANPDVPYIVLNSDDGTATRDSNRTYGAPKILKDGYYIPEMPDASTLFVLARRERIDAVRPFVFDDLTENASVDELNEHGIARRLLLVYAELEKSVPHPDKDRDPQAHTERPPYVAEWLPAAAKYAKEAAQSRAKSSLLDLVKSPPRLPKGWEPTPWFPIPWNRDQLAFFDKLPTLGFIHRPTFVKFVDEHDKPLTRRDARQKALQAGWQAALQNLPEAERAKGPARIITATGGNTDQLIVLHGTMTDYAAHGGPEFDSSKSSQFIDTDRRLGNTGATTLFMQMAIGVMGSYRDGGISAAINLRDHDEASIIFISPPSDEKRKTQQHPGGGDVWRHHGTPAIDPANYQ
jgi:hypothetical protein